MLNETKEEFIQVLKDYRQLVNKKSGFLNRL